MTVSIPGKYSPLVRAASDGKHRPASHPAWQRHGYVPPPPRALPQPKPRMPVIRVRIYGIDPIALKRRRDAERKRAKYHSDPEFRAAQLAATARHRASERGRELRRQAENRRRAARRAATPPTPPKVRMSPEERRRRAAEAHRRRYAEDADYRERRKADQRERDRMKRAAQQAAA